ncbi:Retrovirus-related Pol polyprotein from transposon TNT 1-94 [Bienertia sinuspersici]
MSVSEYFGRLQPLWDELARYHPITTCECGKCTCQIGEKFQIRLDEDRLHDFIYGLNPELYGNVRSSLLAQDPPPSLDCAYQTLLQEERLQRTSSHPRADQDDVMILAIKSHPRGNYGLDHNDITSTLCSYCSKPGHDVATCYKKNGYPDWWETRNHRGYGRGRGIATGSDVIFQPPMAVVRQGRSGNSGAEVRNTVAGMSNNVGIGDPATPTFSNMDGEVALPGMTSAQWQQLLKMLGNSSINKSTDDRLIGEYSFTPWIIDTGASMHVTGNFDLLIHVTDMLACPVGLPDGNKTSSTKCGQVYLAHGLVLQNVLYVPKLNCNLIYVSHLIDDLNCIVQFTNHVCVIQDRNTRTLIGVGEQWDGLYYFHGVLRIQALTINGVVSPELWHKRLGHPSNKALQSLPFVSASSVILNKACDVCHQVKQTRDKFYESDSRSTRCFKMIHCDLWGPYHTPSSCDARYFFTLVDDFPRTVWVILLLDKKKVNKMFHYFFAMIDRQFGAKVKVVRSDNGNEFNCMKEYFFRMVYYFRHPM